MNINCQVVQQFKINVKQVTQEMLSAKNWKKNLTINASPIKLAEYNAKIL